MKRFDSRSAMLLATIMLLIFALCLPAFAVNIAPTGVSAGTGGLKTRGGELGVMTVSGNYMFRVPKNTPGVFYFYYDSDAYFTATQANAGGVTLDSVSDGTAGFTFSDPVTIPAVPIVSEATATRTVTSADFGKIIACSYAGATTITLPNPSAATVGAVFYIAELVDQALTIVGGSTADNNNIIADGVLTTDNVAFSTASHKIGAMAKVTGISATKWLITNASSCAMTVEAAD